MKYILLICVIVSFVGCRKAPPQVPEPEEEQPYPRTFLTGCTPGSYWLYENYAIDSAGQETLFGEVDTVFYAGDSVLNGHNFAVFKGTEFGVSDFVKLMRDSADVAFDENGNIFYGRPYFPGEDTVSTSYDIPNMVIHGTAHHDYWGAYIPAGHHSGVLSDPMVWDVHVHRFKYSNLDQTPFTPCNYSWDEKTVYSAHAGEISHRTSKLTQVQMDCAYIEKRLIYFNM